MSRYYTVLSIAGSDSGGCAGIQADIKSISACGGYAATAITATTAQNTCGVTDIHPIPVEHLAAQLDAVFSDIRIDAVKIGMLHSCEVMTVVREKLLQYEAKNIVLDPVMVATSGDRLIEEASVDCLKRLLPLATVITPNLPEAEILLGGVVDSNDYVNAVQELARRYHTAVLLKGGHDESGSTLTDIFISAPEGEIFSFSHPKIETKNTHGTGCSLTAALATFLARGEELPTAVQHAIDYLQGAIAAGASKTLGKGHGPVDHFWAADAPLR